MSQYGRGAPKDYGWLAEAAKDAGEPPPSVPDPPDVPDYLTWVWEGFTVLSSSRSVGFSGPNKITTADILAYLSLLEVTSSDTKQEFLYYITRMDDRFIEMHNERTKK